MKILLTGSTGFIGSELLPKLPEKDHEVHTRKFMKKPELKIDYDGLICSSCKHPIIWQAADIKGRHRDKLQHIDVREYDDTKIITISDDCICGCSEAID